MPGSDKSFQQLDPVGGYSVRPVTILLSALTVVYAAGTTATGWQLNTVPWLAITALAVSLITSVGAVFWSDPLRAPFSNLGFTWVVGGGILAMVLASASTWSSDPLIGAAWGPIALGLGITQLAPYRPARQLVAATVLGTIVSAFLVVLRPATIVPTKPVLATIAEVTIPLLAIGLASATYASELSRALDGEISSSVRQVQDATAELHAGMVRSVRDDRVGILNLHVVPFFAELLQRDEVVPQDQDRALAIADSIRSVMVADVDRSWLDVVIDQADLGRLNSTAAGSEMIEDDDRLASAMTTEQRTATRALLVALFDHPGFDPDGFGIVLAREGPSCMFALTAKLDDEDSILRSGLAAYLAVLRIMFANLQVTFQAPTLRLRFSYEHK